MIRAIGMVPSGWYQASSSPAAAPSTAPTCLSQADHDQAVKDCSQSIKGLGGLGLYSSGPYAGLDPCALARLPICVQRMVSMTAAPAPRPASVMPKGSLVASTAPATTAPPATYAPIPAMVSSPAPAAPGGWSATTVGLAALVLAGGGYLAYRTFRKPKR